MRFSLLAASTVILFYCFPSSKRGVYLLAAYPFLAVCATAAVGSKVSSEKMRKLFLGGSALAVAVQALILPLVVAPRTSERDLAEVVLRHSSPTARIYSFGYEFYGAAFYSRRLFLRLEDAYSGTLRGMEANDLVLSFDSKAEELDAFLQANGVRARKVDMLPLGRRRVGIYRISQALDADLVATLPNGFDRDI